VVADLQECCETTGVASIDTFWLATAAAAPVIALAAVVVLPDTSGMYRDDVQPVIDEWFDSPANFQAAMQAAGASEWVVEAVSAINLADAKEKVVRAKATRSLRVLVASIRWTAIGNVLLQAVLLALSLAALAYNVHVMPPWLAIVLPVGGIVLLAITVLQVSSYRRAAKAFPGMLEKGFSQIFNEALSAASKTGRGAAEEQVPSSDGNA